MRDPVVLAAVAHPDDIEFYFSGTLLLLKNRGCSIHMWNLADGCCGSTQHTRTETALIRTKEAARSAALAGAAFHLPLFHDLEIFYDQPSLAAVAAVVRLIKPTIILTHAPDDYMEDHQNVCRLITTAAFARGIPNFSTQPEAPTCPDPVRLYHAPPHGLRDGLENRFQPSFLVDVTSTMETKCQMLACHESQQAWLETSQGMSKYVNEMKALCGSLADGRMTYAEGWRRHSHLGFCPETFDPVPELLKAFFHNLTP